MKYIWFIPSDFKTVGVSLLVQEVQFDPPSPPIIHESPTPPMQSNTSFLRHLLMQNITCSDNDFTFPMSINLSIPNNVSFQSTYYTREGYNLFEW